MKKIGIILFISCFSLSILYAGDDIPEEEVPVVVKKYVRDHYPKAGYIEWEHERKKGYYEAEFRIDGFQYELKISESGRVIESKEKYKGNKRYYYDNNGNYQGNNHSKGEIHHYDGKRDVPEKIRTYISDHYPGAEIMFLKHEGKNGYGKYVAKIRYFNGYRNNKYRTLVFTNEGGIIKG